MSKLDTKKNSKNQINQNNQKQEMLLKNKAEGNILSIAEKQTSPTKNFFSEKNMKKVYDPRKNRVFDSMYSKHSLIGISSSKAIQKHIDINSPYSKNSSNCRELSKNNSQGPVINNLIKAESLKRMNSLEKLALENEFNSNYRLPDKLQEIKKDLEKVIIK